MGRKRRVRYIESPTRFGSGVSALAMLGLLLAGLPVLWVLWKAYDATHYWLLLIPLGFMLLWNAFVLLSLLFNSYNALTGKAAATRTFTQIEEQESERGG
jgi:hypothetical protein